MQTTSASGALFTLLHDATLTGNATASSPLGVAVPLILSGSINMGGVIEVTNTNNDGFGVVAKGGRIGVSAEGVDTESGFAGTGVLAVGGSSDHGISGRGLIASGGFTDQGTGNEGVRASGSNSNTGEGGDGVFAQGGSTGIGNAGAGVRISGGLAVFDGNGGHGLVAQGGAGRGNLNSAGHGIVATRGLGSEGAINGLAGLFNGDVEVSGNLNVTGAKNFKIDHPLDPENKYLYHSCVESPDMKNIYDGNVVTDENGEATVTLPEYFQALNREFRYQLAVIGTFAQAIIADEIEKNRFTIKTNAANVKVSWQVTGIRQDAYANKNRIKVEEDKPEREQGYYLHPQAYNQPDERGVHWARNREMMRHMKERRVEMRPKIERNDP